MKILLFDIDHTLLYTGGGGSRALDYAFKKVFNLDGGMKEVSVAGKTDPLIVAEVVKKRLNASPTAEEISDALDVYIKRLAIEIADTSSGHIKKGLLNLLNELSTRDDILLGILTGNIEGGANLKLDAFNLRGYFRFGAYSSDSPDRNKLVAVAKERAERLIGRKLAPSEPIVVIGDTPYDIACAKAAGVYSIAVATGPYSVEELKQNNPNLVIEDLDSGKEIFLNFVNSLER
ncbi:MAG: HAD family hydrolase [Myxococcota bacterium]